MLNLSGEFPPLKSCSSCVLFSACFGIQSKSLSSLSGIKTVHWCKWCLLPFVWFCFLISISKYIIDNTTFIILQWRLFSFNPLDDIKHVMYRLMLRKMKLMFLEFLLSFTAAYKIRLSAIVRQTPWEGLALLWQLRITSKLFYFLSFFFFCLYELYHLIPI